MHKLLSYHQAKESLSLQEKIGQLFMPAAFINDTEEEIQQLEKLIRNQKIGGLCFFHSRASAATNFEGKKKVQYNTESYATLKTLIKRYQKAAKHPMLMAIDAEWGLAMRIENTPQYPYAITLGALQGDDALIFEVGKNIARDCKAAGIHWNLAPCIDINNNPHNPVIGYRSFGEDKFAVTAKAKAFVKGTESEGILTSIKHFPGHGDTATDSHLGLPLINKSKEVLLANELFPFQKLIEEGVDSVMVGHLNVPALAAGAPISSSISKNTIKGFLRGELGYDGVVISDALNMHAVSKDYPTKGELEWLAFDAGNDVLCFAEHVVAGMATIQQKASEQQIEESFKRIWKLKEKAIKNMSSKEVSPTNEIPKIDTELNRKLAHASLTLYQGSETTISEVRNADYYTLKFPENDPKILSKAQEHTNVLLLITPPKVKPAGNFGFSQNEIDFINTLIQTKNVVLYLFGNPYVLNHLNIENAKAVVIAYQAFTAFKEVAYNHFLGKMTATGKLPVTIK